MRAFLHWFRHEWGEWERMPKFDILIVDGEWRLSSENGEGRWCGYCHHFQFN